MTEALPLILLVGPTGVGKTRVAVDIARKLGGELVGADSMQVYRGFDIGSAKPTPDELGEIRHHMIDVANADEPFDAARYATMADAVITDIQARGALPIVVGGTGLWLRALLRGLVDVPAVDAELRAQLEKTWDEVGGLEMHARLSKVDPISAARVHVNDKLRVVRALEVHAQTGKALGELRQEHALGAARYRDLTVVLDVPLAHYPTTIATRTRDMIERGFAQEVAALIMKYGANVRPLQAVGYKQMVEHLTTGVSIRDTEIEIVRATLTYARRQRTWWKTDPNVSLRVTPAEALEEASLDAISAHASRAR